MPAYNIFRLSLLTRMRLREGNRDGINLFATMVVTTKAAGTFFETSEVLNDQRRKKHFYTNPGETC